MTESKIKMANESLERAVNNQSEANYETIINGFMEMGISESDIIPRVNVFTFNAWKALGRVVKKGEKGVRVVTWIPCTKKDEETGEEIKVTKKKSTTVFHIIQTQPIDAPEDNAPVIPAEPEPEPELEERRQHYADKLAARQERYESLSANAQTKGHALHSKAHKMAEAIPFGQPILIGHHSEKRDRRYRDRIHSTFGKAFEELSKAEYYEKKAATVGTGGISSDDPDAIAKLKEKLEGMQKNQELMKNCNKVIRKFKNKESQLAELVKLGISQDNAEKLLEDDGFAPYALKNNNANMGRVKERISELEKTQNLSAQAEEYESFSYELDSLDNRIVFTFTGKPDEETRKILKSHSFKFSPSRSPKGRSVWVRKVTLNALHDARRVKKQLLK